MLMIENFIKNIPKKLNFVISIVNLILIFLFFKKIIVSLLSLLSIYLGLILLNTSLAYVLLIMLIMVYLIDKQLLFLKTFMKSLSLTKPLKITVRLLLLSFIPCQSFILMIFLILLPLMKLTLKSQVNKLISSSGLMLTRKLLLLIEYTINVIPYLQLKLLILP